MEDSVVDIAIMALSDTKPQSLADVRVWMKANLLQMVSGASALVATGALERIAVKIWLYFNGSTIKIDSKLMKLVKSAKASDKFNAPLFQLFSGKGKCKAIIRCPNFKEDDTNSKNHLDSLATLVHYTCGIAATDILVYKDEALGDKLIYDSVHAKLIDELTASASLPSGIYPGEVVSLGGYKGNLPSLLASMHLLARKRQYLRKRTPMKGEKVVSVTGEELRKIFNSRAGLVDKTNSIPIMIFKSILASIVSARNRVFPGGWIVSNRQINQVKSDIGLVFKLGWAEKCPDYHKLEMVLKFKPSVDPKGKISIKDQSEEKEWTFLEFRTGSVLTAPFLDPNKSETFKQQRRTEPLQVKNEATLDVLGNSKYFKIVNTLNRAHAILLNVQQGNKKLSLSIMR